MEGNTFFWGVIFGFIFIEAFFMTMIILHFSGVGDLVRKLYRKGII